MAIGTATAILGSAIIGAGASAAMSSSAAKSAAKTSQQATDAATTLQNKALDTQQANTAVIRNAGDTATTALLERLGLGPKPAGPAPGGINTQAYLQNNPDVAQAFEQERAKGYQGDAASFAQQHFDQYGKNEGRAAEMTPAAPTAPAAPTRPDLVQTPGYQAPTQTATPGFQGASATQQGAYQGQAATQQGAYQAPSYVDTPAYQTPEMDALDVSLSKYERAPDYEFQQQEARRGTLAGAAATGSLRSGAAAKALQDRAQQVAYGDYTNWRNYSTGQYNTDRSRTDQNAQFGYNALQSNNQQKNAANTQNAQFGYNAQTQQNQFGDQLANQNAQFGYNALTQANQFKDSMANQNAQFGYNALVDQNRFKDTLATDASQFGYNAMTQQNSQANQFNQQNFNTDRAYNADQQQQGTSNLFALSGLGASATGANNNAIANTANNNSNALFSNAATQGNASLAAAGQTNNAINTGVNALSYYYGNKAQTPAAKQPVSAWNSYDGA